MAFSIIFGKTLEMKRCITLTIAMLAGHILFGQHKGTATFSVDAGTSIPIGTYKSPGYNADAFSGEPGAYAISGFNFKANTAYYAFKNLAFAGSFFYNQNVFNGIAYEDDVKKKHQPSVNYDMSPIGTDITQFTNWTHIGFTAGIMSSIPIKKFVIDGKALFGFNSYTTPVINQITKFDDPFEWNYLEDTRIKSSAGSTYAMIFGINIRYQLKRLGFGISFETVSTKIDSKADYTWEERDDYSSYDYQQGKYNWKFSAAWININGGLYYTIGRIE